MADEIELARRLLAGDQLAFDRFVEVFRHKVFQYSYLVCGQRDDAEEVAQETLLRIFERFEQLREPEHVRSWVFRIAKNICTVRRRRSVFAPTEELPLDPTVADRCALPDAQAITNQRTRLLHEAIRELPDIYRSVLLLRDLEQLSTEETAEVLDISIDSVKTRLHRARSAVREKIEEIQDRPRPLHPEARAELFAAYERARP